MAIKTEKDFWVEMSIREIWTQSHFAMLAYKNINPKAINGNDLVFSSIHSFLSHCANVSKMLMAADKEISPKAIGDILGVSKKSEIHNRKFRNHLEHYDERLKKWIKNRGANASIATYCIGPKSAIQSTNTIFVSYYDPTKNILTFVDEDYNLGVLYDEAKNIMGLADSWVSKIQVGVIKPPFI